MAGAVRRLFLLRHAKSDWSEPGQADRERRLSGRGRRVLPLVADYLAADARHVQLVVSSSARRTRETVEGVVAALPWDVAVQYDDDLYAASADTILDTIRRLPPETECALLCGHNPGLHDLALRLAAGRGELVRDLAVKLPTAGLVGVDVLGEWGEVGPDICRLVAFVTPATLPG